MAKRRRKKRRSSVGQRLFGKKKQQPSVDLTPVIERAESLIRQGQVDQAMDLLTPLLEKHPGVAELHYIMGYAQAKAGEPWRALEAYERALKLSREPFYWVPIGWIFLELGLTVHAIYAYRKVERAGLDDPPAKEARERLPALEAELATFAHDLGIKSADAEQGLYQVEEGIRALNRGDIDGSLSANQRAARILKNWPPVQNNLSLGLFWAGQPDKAIETAQRVLDGDPENIQALGNLIRFLAWSGRTDEARERWVQLQAAQPQSHTDVWKTAEAAAILDEDQVVYDLLQPWITPESGGLSVEMARLRGVAEANLGQRKVALKRLHPLERDFPLVEQMLAALEAGSPGPGLAERFPYFHSSELIVREKFHEFLELLALKEEMPAERFQKKVDRFVQRFPQIVLVGEKLIWEEDLPEAGFDILETVGTEAAFEVLHRFATSKAGDDELRRTAIFRLQRAGWLPPTETIRMWQDGEWQDVGLRIFEIVDERDVAYAPAVANRLNRGVNVLNAGRPDDAEKIFLEAVALDPEAKEGYNNLGVIYSRQKRQEEAEAMFQRAAEVDPHYVMPRTNLAAFRLDEGDVEGAKAILAPLAQATRFTVEELVLYASTQAQVYLADHDFDAARESLKTALFYDPDNEELQSLQTRLDVMKTLDLLQSSFADYSARSAKRGRAKRLKMQTVLTTRSPSLDEALSPYTKDELTLMARIIVTSGGWSTLRKAELRARIVESLQDPDNMERLVTDLGDDERRALGDVLAGGGALAWRTFDERYGNDLDDPPHSQSRAPESVMGRLRVRGLLAEATVDDELLVVIPVELRPLLATALK